MHMPDRPDRERCSYTWPFVRGQKPPQECSNMCCTDPVDDRVKFSDDVYNRLYRGQRCKGPSRSSSKDGHEVTQRCETHGGRPGMRRASDESRAENRRAQERTFGADVHGIGGGDVGLQHARTSSHYANTTLPRVARSESAGGSPSSFGLPGVDMQVSGDEVRILGQLDSNLANRGLRRSDVPGDNNCQFHAMAHQLQAAGLGKWTAQQLRMKAVAWLDEHRDALDTESVPNWDVYLREMNQHDRTWGDEATLLALSTIFKVRVIVVSSTSSEYCHTIEPHNVPSTDVPPDAIYLGHYHEFHYVSTAPA